MNYALSNAEVEKLITTFTKDEPRIIVVDEKFGTFTKEFVFGSNDYCVLFLGNQNHVGHWTMIHHQGKYIEYFDNLGGMDYNVFQFIRNNFPDHFVRLMRGRLQSKRSAICGKYITLRIMTRHSMDTNVFYKFLTTQTITGLKRPDSLVNKIINIGGIDY